MKPTFIVILTFLFYSCSSDRILLGDWEARDSVGGYTELAVYDNFIQIYSDVAGVLPSWDYTVENDSMKTSILNYKMNWINQDSLVLQNDIFNIELRRIKTGTRLSEVEGDPENNESFMNGFYQRSGILDN